MPMIKIMVVDDDFLIRSNIKLLLAEIAGKDLSVPYELIGEAGDGEEAKEMAALLRPDIIISDIRMPKMDGIKLQEYVKIHFPRIQVIMLSNYDDYEYVREALRNGAVDYILKHKLTAEVLKATLIRAAGMMKKTDSQELARGSSLAALKRDFVLSLIAGFTVQKEDIQSRIQAMGLPLAENNIIAIIMTVERNAESVQEAYLMEFTIINILDEILQDTVSGICCHVTGEKYVILLSHGLIYSEKARQERTFEIISRISSCLKKFLNRGCAFYQGILVAQLQEVKKSYQTAEEKYRNRYYSNSDKNMENSNKPFDILAVFDAGKERALMSCIRAGDYTGTMNILRDIFEELRRWSPSLSESQIVFIDLLGVLNRACKEQLIDLGRIYTEKTPLQEKFNEFTSIETAKQWFIALYDRVLKEEGEGYGLPVSDYVDGAVTFIHRHYGENISQTDVAGKIGISSSYLSRIFKENLNIGFMEYLNNYRLEKAKVLLEQGKLSNKAIALLCGFQDDGYFSKVFKRHAGMTPKEYRKEAARQKKDA